MPASAGTDALAAVPPERLAARSRACFLGAALGDALGSTVEFMTRDEIRSRYGTHDKLRGGGWLYLKPGQVTDDTQMSLCIARALAGAGNWNLLEIAEQFSAWLRRGPVDVGATCAQGIRRFMHTGALSVKRNRWHAGNGALMRMAPVALATVGNDSRLAACAAEQAHLTHNHPLSDAACVAVGRMVHAGLLGWPREQLLALAADLVARHPEFRYQPYRGNASGYVADSVATAFHHFFTTTSFEDCLVGVVNEGGDADTNGCIAGMLAGAYYGESGLPKRWLKKLYGPVCTEIKTLVDPLLQIARARISTGDGPCTIPLARRAPA